MKRLLRKLRLIFPIPAAILLGLGVFSAVVHLISGKVTAVSDFINLNISPYIRAFTATLTGILPFSLAEFLILCAPILLVVVVYVCIKVSKGPKYATARYIVTLLSIASLVYSTFVFSFGASYNNTSLDKRLGLERKDVSAQQLYTAARYMILNAERELDDIEFIYGAESVMPYSLDEMVELLNVAYERISERYDFIPSLDAPVKYVMLSEPMSYTHITGVYTFFTGEANLNINFPEYSLPFTAAHEMSHQRGIGPENEANFMAFLVCIESGDPYIRYSGYLNMYEYLANALYSADPNLYYSLLDTIDLRIRYEMRAYSEFFDQYRETVVAEVSGAVNDTYLKIQGQTAGTKSYGLVVDLAVAWVLNE